jgi:hypothetical protein
MSPKTLWTNTKGSNIMPDRRIEKFCMPAR